MGLQLLGRSVGHVTPRYVYNRIKWAYYQRTHPDHPWLTPQANWLLERLLSRNDRGIEFGSGRSTIWLAQRLGHLISIESDAEWHERVRARLADEEIQTVDYRYCRAGQETCISPEWEELLEQLSGERFDVILVDGAYRDHCAHWATDTITCGGLLVVDNVNWFLPSNSRAPASVAPEGEPQSPVWAAFAEEVRDWRLVWTSQGITDTAIWIRPQRERQSG